VLGITGLLGSGFEELVHVLFGAREGEGKLEVAGETVEVSGLTPRRAMDLGMGFVPADRPLDAVIGSLSVADNVTMTTLAAHRGRLGLSRAGLKATAAEIGERHAVVPNRPELPLQALSGGNQQKAVLGKWLRIDPPVLLLDQPTQGVDVRAREQIFSAVRAAAARGTAVVCASADYEELAGLCDRVLVLARGAVALELSGDELTKERIAEQVLTSTSAGDALATN
jgi:ribose transport system ATP-binding protein